jgi:hypothetical protein
MNPRDDIESGMSRWEMHSWWWWERERERASGFGSTSDADVRLHFGSISDAGEGFAFWVDFGCSREIGFWVHFRCSRGICIWVHFLRIGLCGVNESNCPKWLSPRNVLILDLMMPSGANRKIGHIQDAIPHWGLYVIKVHGLIEIFLQFLVGSHKV